MYIKSIKHLNQIVPQSITNVNQLSVQISGITFNLNKDYLYDLFDYIYHQYLQNCDDEDSKKEVLFPLSSKVLRKRYGNSYTKYIQYFIDNAYIRLILNEIEGKRCRRYKLVDWKIKRVGLVHQVNVNRNLIKKQNKQTLNADYSNSSYSKSLLGTITKNLDAVTIKKNSAINYLNNQFSNPMHRKYLKNYKSILDIDDRNIYMTCDEYGRIHTNFTTLKKEIRNQFLLIDNDPIQEVDIKNSQPLFFLYLLSKNLNKSINQGELLQFQEDVLDGKIYIKLASFYGVDREYMKKIFFRFLYGKSGTRCKAFTKYYPSITDFINKFKDDNEYKKLAQELQRLEGKFIFKEVCQELTNRKIKYFTVHDSINVKMDDYPILVSVFNNKLNNLKKEIINNNQNYYR